MMWRSTTLGEACTEGGGSIQTGPFGSQLHASDYVADGIPSVMPQNIGDNVINPEGIARITHDDAARLSRYLLREGDIVYSRRGDVEKRALVRAENDGWLCGTGCLRVRLGGGTAHDPRFLTYYLGTEAVRAWIVRHAVGATMPNLNTSILESVPVRVAPIAAQRAIAEVLGALDDKIAANAALLSAIDEYLGARFASLVADCNDLTPLKELADVNAIVTKPVPGSQLRYVDIASVGVGRFDFPELSSGEDVPSRARRTVRHGDTLWSTVRPDRRSHALNLSTDPSLIASTGLAVLTPKTVGFAYLYELTRRLEFTEFLESAAEGSAYPAVRAERFGDAIVPLADVDARDKFEMDAAPLRELGALREAESRTLAAMRDALLPQLMSGKIRVRDAERVVGKVV